MWITLVLFLSLLLAPLAQSATNAPAPPLFEGGDGSGALRYAAPNGGGTTCSQAIPCSLSTCLSLTQAGQSCILRDGTYSAPLNTVRSGTAGNHIVIRAENNRKAIILNTTQGAASVNIDDNYITLRGLFIDDNRMSREPNSPIDVGNQNIHHVIIEDNVVFEGGNTGIGLGPGRTALNHHLIVRHNLVDGTGYNSTDANGEGIYAGSAPAANPGIEDVIIYGNEIRDFLSNAFDLKQNVNRAWVYDNLIHSDSTAAAHGCACPSLRRDGAILVSGSAQYVYNNTVRDLITPFRVFQLRRSKTTSESRVFNNVIYNTPQANQVAETDGGNTGAVPLFYNNTVWNVENHAVAQPDFTVTVRNNLGINGIANNLATGSFTSAYFVNASQGDFRLTASATAARDAATGEPFSGPDHDGNAIHNTTRDYGAYEFVVVPTPPPDPPEPGEPGPNPLISSTGVITNPVIWTEDSTPTSGCNTIYYFDNVAGSDGLSCTGSEANACKSMTRMKGITYSPGNCVLFRCGSEWVNDDPQWDARPNGTDGNPIVFGAYGCSASNPNRPKWRFTSSGVTENFDGNDKHIDRIQCEGCDTWRFVNGGTRFELTNLFWKNSQNAAFSFRRQGGPVPHHILLENIHLDGVGPLTGLVDGTGEAFYGCGTDGGATDITIRNFYVTNGANDVVSLKVDCANWLVENGLITGNRHADDPGFISSQNVADPNANNIIRNIAVINNGNDSGINHPAVYLGEGTTAYNLIVHNNLNTTGFRGKATSKLYHSTFYDLGGEAISSSNLTPAANIKGNILTSSIPGNISPSAELFVDAGMDIFRLAVNSAAIDLYSSFFDATYDIEGIERPQGGLSDAGAFEFTTETPPPPLPDGDPWTGLVAWYTFDNTLLDSVGSAHLQPSTVTYAAGTINQASRYNGASWHSPLGALPASVDLYPTPGQPWSVTAFFKTAATGTVVARAVEATADRDFQIAISATDIDFYHAGAISSTTGDYNDGQWHHVAVVWNGNTMHWYMDGGVEQGIATVGTSPEDVNENVYIAARTGGNGYRCGDATNTCDIDDVRFYDRALTAEDVATVYVYDGSAPTPSSPTNLELFPVSATELLLNWQTSTGAVAAYHIEACTGEDCSTFAEVDTTPLTFFSATELTPGLLYRFRVRARSPANTFSGYSNVAEAIPVLPIRAVRFNGGRFNGGRFGAVTE